MARISCWPFPGRWSKLRQKKTKTCRIAVVGDKGSGKTSLIFRFSRGRMPSGREEVASVLETDDMDVLRNGRTIRLIVNDTSGEEDYAKIRALAYNQVNCVIICLPLDSPEALQRLESEWAPEIRHLCKGTPFVLAGTKVDLRESLRLTTCPNENCYVTARQGKKLAKKMGAVAYLECSALDGSGEGKDVKRVFGKALREGLRRR